MSNQVLSPRRPLTTLLAALALALAGLLVPVAAQAAVTQGIAGTITRSEPASMSAVVTAFLVGQKNETASVSTGSNGAYELALAPGSYWIKIAEPGQAPEWNGNSPTRGGSTPVVVTAGQVTTVNAEVAPGGSISGTVSVPTAGGYVWAYVADASYPGGYADYRSNVSNGTYTLSNLPAGDYKLNFQVYDENNIGFESWWNGKTTLAAADPITVTPPTAVTGINPTLTLMGSISGTVTASGSGDNVPDVLVQLWMNDGTGWGSIDGSAFTEANGTYSMFLPSGTYRVEFRPTNASVLKKEFWNNADTVQAGQSVVITAGSPPTDLDAQLDPLPPLQNLTKPSITGTRKVGSTLTGVPGTWNADPEFYAIQWLRNGVVVPHPNDFNYQVTAADAGKRITMTITAQRTGLEPVTVSTLPATIALQVLTLTTKPAVLGKPKVGKRLRAVAPRSTPAATVRYQWLRNGVAIKGATRATYKLVRKDKRKKVGVRITLSKPGYATVVRKVVRATKVR
ncbi:carboxypeptidase regulatory-like domain-containing protein [Nocardioides marmoriginsengisoli]|uniref:Carboxypeptidase regulatory-like domain-containing protein n=1 Tax=Nocardioides marmoriginsengisoli TaxID=661483 RepID=A0A3N0CQW8_9ACTN|nr:carboxypeptidase regulatory-like domain-containing protein [Nocardioides marmoriginsengisoli]RNL65426.1 carboxypeptidase regulatory-like domain-containing protein [Nocardioides marmoriginsengisoli]